MKIDALYILSREHFAAASYLGWSLSGVSRLISATATIALSELLGVEVHSLRAVAAALVFAHPFGAVLKAARTVEPAQPPAAAMFI